MVDIEVVDYSGRIGVGPGHLLISFDIREILLITVEFTIITVP